MIDSILAGALISIQRYQAAEPQPAPPSNVIEFAPAAERQRQKRAAQWLRTYTRPMPPGPRAA